MESKENFWQQFAIEVNGNFSEGKYGRSDKVELIDNGWNVFFDHYLLVENGSNASQLLTRILIPFTSNNDFKFEIYRKELFDSIAKFFGGQDVVIGYENFDKDYIVKSNNEQKIKSLLRDSDIRKSIQSISKVNIQISNQHGIWEEHLPKNEYELSLYVEGAIVETEKLTSLWSLLIRVLEKLILVNSQTKPKACRQQ